MLKIIKQGEVKACASTQMLNEVERVLGYRKFQRRLQALGYTISDLVSAVQEQVLLVEVPEQKIILIPADPKDDMFLHCAFYAQVDFIISGDKHLLSLGEYRGISIVKVHDFLKIVRG